MVVGEPASSGPIGSQVGGAYHDHPAPRTEATMAEAGGCRYVAARPALCEPACTGSDVCDVDGHCGGYPTTLTAGTLTVTGTTPPITLEPQPGNSYYPQTSYPGLYRPGDDVAKLDRAVHALTAQGKTVSAQRVKPAKLRCNSVLRLEDWRGEDE